MYSLPNFLQSFVPCKVLTVASWPAYRFLWRQVRWSGVPIFWRILPFVVIHAVKSFSIVNKAVEDVFLEFPCFFYYDPMDVGHPMDVDSSVFSKSSLYISEFSVHILLKPNLKDFEHYLASMWNEYNCVVFEHSLALPFYGTGMKTDLFPVATAEFSKLTDILSAALTASSFRIWNSSAGILSPPLALFVVMLPKTHLT